MLLMVPLQCPRPERVQGSPECINGTALRRRHRNVVPLTQPVPECH